MDNLEISAISKQKKQIINVIFSSSQAFFQGKLKINGNMGLAMKLQNLQLQPGKAKLRTPFASFEDQDEIYRYISIYFIVRT